MNKKPNIIELNDFGGKRQEIDDLIKEGYKISSTASFKTTTGSYTRIVFVRKNWIERIFKL